MTYNVFSGTLNPTQSINFSRRTRPGRGSNRSSATANVKLYCTWRPSGLTIGLHGQITATGNTYRKFCEVWTCSFWITPADKCTSCRGEGREEGWKQLGRFRLYDNTNRTAWQKTRPVATVSGKNDTLLLHITSSDAEQFSELLGRIRVLHT